MSKNFFIIFNTIMGPSILNYQKPITKLPDKLIFLRNVNTVMHPAQKEFVIFSPKTKNLAGIMRCHESCLDLRPDYKGMSLAVDFIETYTKNRGYGKALIEFAKRYSKETGCGGYVFLKAVHTFSPMKVPHLFYRKLGFTTLDSETDKLMDKFIKQNKTASAGDFSPMLMFYPKPETQEKDNIAEQLVNLYKKLMSPFG